MTEREEEIRGRLEAVHSAARGNNHERLANALADAEAHAFRDVAWLIGYLDEFRKNTGRVAA